MTAREFFDRYGIALGVLVALVAVVAIVPGNASDQQIDTGFGSDSFSGDDGFDSGGDDFASPSIDPTTGDTIPFDSGFATGDGGGDVATGTGGTSGGGTADGSSTGGTTAPGGSTSGQAAQPGSPAPTPSGGGGAQFGTGPNCRPDGKQVGISFYMPPCVQWTPGSDNGGATFRGVSKDKVVVVRYLAQLDPGTEAILSGARLADDGPVVKRAYDQLRHYSNLHYETYGREIVFMDVEASGASESEEAMRADAIKITNDIKPFAVIDGNPAAPMPNILAQELARRGVLCLCTTSVSSQFYNELPPAIFSSLPTIDEYAGQTAEYIGKKLAGKNAEFAGDELNPLQDFKNTPRKYGLIYLNGARGKVDPEGARARDAMIRELARYGIQLSSQVGYIYDPGRNQADVTNVIAKMKGDGVTTIIPLWDPLYPILITQEATRQQYFPEWFIVGTGLSDTTTAGRLYDQQQWRHAFGISPLWVTWKDVPASAGYREYHHAKPDASNGEEGVLINVYRARIETLFRGFHMAGPNVTNDSYVRGLINTPPTGGTAGLPTRFVTRQFPTEIKDFVEVWYGADDTGPDERGEMGRGVIWKTNQGKRYRPGQWDASQSRAFDKNGVIHVSNDPPGGTDAPHERDGHTHPTDKRCLSCR